MQAGSRPSFQAPIRVAAPQGFRRLPLSGQADHQAQAFLDLGLALGFGGELSFERALRIRRLVRELPPDAHVLETDAPDIAPAWIRPGRNSPTELPRIAQVFASLRGTEVGSAVAVTGSNALRVLPRLGAAAG